jgi:hypothetical protein
MKVVDLGHGGLVIEPESRPADSVQALTHARLVQSSVSNEAIDIYQRYVERTSTPPRTVTPPSLIR